MEDQAAHCEENVTKLFPFKEHQHDGFSVIVIPCLSDNYIYLLKSHGSPEAVAVDVGDAEPLLAVLSAKGWQLKAVLLTHNHADHVMGLGKLLRQVQLDAGTAATVFAPQGVYIKGMTHGLIDGEQFRVAGIDFCALDTPGHTLGHLTYLAGDAAFTGDALFGGGCGRLLEGTADQLFSSLQKIAVLPPATRLYVGHEYTLANLRFAISIDSNNLALATRIKDAKQTISQGGFTSPSDLALELATNPFLRCEESAIKRAMAKHAEGKDPLAVFSALRQAKDLF